MEPDKKLKVLIVGSGGREHALVLAVKRSPMLDSLVCAPGNGGIGRDCETVNISAEDVDAIVEYVLKNKIDFVICGPEVPLWLGLADKLREKSVPVYGPSKNGAILEASKAYSKNFLKKYSIPTAEGANFTDPDAAEKYIRSAPFLRATRPWRLRARCSRAARSATAAKKLSSRRKWTVKRRA